VKFFMPDGSEIQKPPRMGGATLEAVGVSKRRLKFWAEAAGLCAYCGKPTDLKDAEVDHVLPKCQGGTDDATNLVMACRACNNRKGGRAPEEAGMELGGSSC